MARRKKTPSRNSKGRFVKKSKTRRSRSTALVVRRKRGRKPRAHLRKIKGRSRKVRVNSKRTVKQHTRKLKGGRRVRVRRHKSREETSMKRRSRRRSRAREVVAAERKPRRRRRRARESNLARYQGSVHHVGGSGLATKPKRRKRRKAKKSTALARRRARRSPKRYGRKVTVSRKYGKRRRATTVYVAGRKRGRYGKKVRVTRRYKGRKRTRTVYVSERKRRKSPRRRRRSYARAMYENPIGMGGYALENPLSGKEMVLALVTGAIGYTAAEMVDRFLATTAKGTDDASKQQEALANAGLVQGAPNLKRGFAQAGVAAVPFLAAYYVKNPMGRAALQGFGLGAAFRLLGQLVRTMLVGRLLKDNAMAQRLYGDTIAADNGEVVFQQIQDQMVTAPVGTQGVPNRALGMGMVLAPRPLNPLLNPSQIGTILGGQQYAQGAQGGIATYSSSGSGGSQTVSTTSANGNGGSTTVSTTSGSGGGNGGNGVTTYGGSGGGGGGPVSILTAGGNGGNVPVLGGGAIPGSVPYGTPVAVQGASQSGNCIPCGSGSMTQARQAAANAAQAGLGGVPFNPYTLGVDSDSDRNR